MTKPKSPTKGRNPFVVHGRRRKAGPMAKRRRPLPRETKHKGKGEGF